jgi:hypothetical protein
MPISVIESVGEPTGACALQETSSFPVNPVPLAMFNAFWTWADAGFGAAINLIDYQRQLWQPWIDLQSTLVQLSHVDQKWPDPASLLFRGTEQLA